jgi:hypothetical protein
MEREQWRALDFGYESVFVMPAGIIRWQEAGLAVEKGN